MNLLHNTTHFTLIITNNNKSIDNSYILSTLYSDLSIIKMFSRTITAAFLAVYPPLKATASCRHSTSTSQSRPKSTSLVSLEVPSLNPIKPPSFPSHHKPMLKTVHSHHSHLSPTVLLLALQTFLKMHRTSFLSSRVQTKPHTSSLCS
jgi:hypothetical protein